MLIEKCTPWLTGALLCTAADLAVAQDVGSIVGTVYDKDFQGVLPGVEVLNLSTEQKVTTDDQGNFVLREVPAGTYTLVLTKDGYVRQVRADVVVQAGELRELEVWMPGDFTDMEEFVVEEGLGLASGSEAALLELRLESPSLLDSISADLMSKAGASDAAGAVRLIAGATVKEDNTAVIRGLPDRYVVSLLNGVRLPSAVEDKRAVQLDQFPSTVIETIQVSKSFTPDMQGDSSGGAVNVLLKQIPDQSTFFVKLEGKYNSQVSGISDFLTYDGGGTSFFGFDDRPIQYDNLGGNWDGAVGTRTGSAPPQAKFSFGAGRTWELSNDWTLGASLSYFHELDASYYDDGISDDWEVVGPNSPLTPTKDQEQGFDEFYTALFDVTQGTQSVQWGALGSVGLESEDNYFGLSYLYSHSAQDRATLSTNTRGKEYFFPGYDPNDENSPGYDQPAASPYMRFETLEYSERTATSLQLYGRHYLPFGETKLGSSWSFQRVELDWIASRSTANLDQPDKRQFSAAWTPVQEPFPGLFVGGWSPYKPSATFALGNLQRIWKTIDETSNQVALNAKWPFEQWNQTPGYLKAGIFRDEVGREFTQESFSNFNDQSGYIGDFDDPWSDVFPDEDHPITAAEIDVNYDGEQNITAFYGMMDLPFDEYWAMVAGARVEQTELSIVNDPEPDAVWFPPGAIGEVSLNPGDADVSLDQTDLLPSLGLSYDPVQEITFRASYSQTLARQTFKEITPILQQEYLGAPIFIGNPELQTSSIENYDLRVDYRPYRGSLLSLSYFYKDLEDPIEYVQDSINFTFTTPRNYPYGSMQGIELEARQSLGEYIEGLEGLDFGANATFIESSVRLTDREITDFSDPAIQKPATERDMTGAPEHLYNLFLTYDLEATGTQLGLFYTVQGDTLVAGAAAVNNVYIPSVYQTEYDSLNFSLQQALGEYFTLTFKARNLTNPDIQTVYRDQYIVGDTVRTSFSRGVELSLAIGARIAF